jgi:imidazolonepropionase-like amidohydrolase
MMRLTIELHKAGVPLMAGSDAGGPPGVFPGVSMHEELILLVELGLTPYEALKTATLIPAIYLEGEGEIGLVEKGCRADLVLLEANPLEDIVNVRTRVGVMKRGRWFGAEELESGLERLAEARIGVNGKRKRIP